MMADGSTQRASSYSALSRLIASASSAVSCAVNVSARSALPWSAGSAARVNSAASACVAATLHAATGRQACSSRKHHQLPCMQAAPDEMLRER